MCVEHAFKILKETWQIIMRKADIPLQHMIDIVVTYIVQHNMCTIRNDKFDMKWLKTSREIIE